MDREKEALTAIFQQFKLAPKEYSSRVERHFRTLKSVRRKLDTDRELSFEEVSAFISNSRIDHIVEEWNRLLEDQARIFEPRDTFLKILNELMQRKTLAITDSNELQITTQSGKNLPLQLLSSGEKQLVIVLGEALLQQQEPWVYIADEPELSLHVKWQECLVENLLSINPNAQIIFATHSPDVVGGFSGNVLDMEDILDQ